MVSLCGHTELGTSPPVANVPATAAAEVHLRLKELPVRACLQVGAQLRSQQGAGCALEPSAFAGKAG